MIESRLLNRLKGALVPSGSPTSVPDRPGWSTWGASGEVWEPEARHHFVEAYRDRVWVQRCVNLISKSFTQVMLKALQGEKELEDHAILDLFRRPNPRDPALLFFEWTALWSQIVGDWYWEAIPARGGGIAELYPLRSHLVRVTPGEGGKIKGYVYDPNATGETLEYDAADPASGRVEANQVISGRFASPLDDWYGLPPLRGAKDDIVSEYYAIRYDHRFFRNSARPDIAILFKKDLDPTQRRANREAWEDFRGVDNAHKAAVLDGDPRLEKVTAGQKDVEYLEGRRLAREGECAAFGVPPVLVGDLTRATYSNYKESETIFWKGTMLPLLEFFASWANWTIVPYFPDVDEIAFDTSMIQALQESENEKVERLVRGIQGGIYTPAEGRDECDLEEINEPAANRLYLPMSAVPIAGEGVEEEKAAEQAHADEIAQAVRDAQGNGNGNQPNPSDNGTDPAQAALNGSKARSRKDSFSHYATIRERTMDHLADVTRQRMGIPIRKAGKEVEAIVAGKGKVSEMERALEQYGWGTLGVKLEEILQALHLTIWGEATEQTVSLLGAEVSLGNDAPQVQALLRELANRPDGIKSIDGRLKDDVIEEVRFGISKGIPNRGIATGGEFDVGPPGARDEETVVIKGVRGVFQDYETWQAERIARTEATMAYNRSSAIVMREVGVEYVDILDGDGDADCAEANGSRWTLDEFEANPIGHPNCQRLGLPVIETGPKQAQLELHLPPSVLEHHSYHDAPQIHAHVEPTPVKVEVHPPAPSDEKVTMRHTPVRDEKTGQILYVDVEPIPED